MGKLDNSEYSCNGQLVRVLIRAFELWAHAEIVNLQRNTIRNGGPWKVKDGSPRLGDGNTSITCSTRRLYTSPITLRFLRWSPFSFYGPPGERKGGTAVQKGVQTSQCEKPVYSDRSPDSPGGGSSRSNGRHLTDLAVREPPESPGVLGPVAPPQLVLRHVQGLDLGIEMQ